MSRSNAVRRRAMILFESDKDKKLLWFKGKKRGNHKAGREKGE